MSSDFPNVIVEKLLIVEAWLLSYFKDNFYLFVYIQQQSSIDTIAIMTSQQIKISNWLLKGKSFPSWIWFATRKDVLVRCATCFSCAKFYKKWKLLHCCN